MRRSTVDVYEPSPTKALPWPVEVIEAALEPVVLPERLTRFEQVARARIGTVSVVLEAVIDPHNTAAVLRTTDALGLGEVHFIDRGVRPLIAPRITRNSERWLDIHVHRRSSDCTDALTSRGFEVYVADGRASTSLDQIAHRPKVALVFGNEHEGASEEVRQAATGTFAIPMRGMVESYNVSVAAAIALYTVTREREGDLEPVEVRALRARFLMESVRNHVWVIERYLRDGALR